MASCVCVTGLREQAGWERGVIPTTQPQSLTANKPCSRGFRGGDNDLINLPNFNLVGKITDLDSPLVQL